MTSALTRWQRTTDKRTPASLSPMPLNPIAERLPFPVDSFADVIQANQRFAESFEGTDLTGVARRGLAVVTCMDSRINPLEIVGMSAGDVKILRNAGARVTDDVIRTLVLATYLLGVTRILVMPHTDCRMCGTAEADIHVTIRERYGVDTRSLEFRTSADVQGTLISDVTRLRAVPLLPSAVVVGGAVYDVGTGALTLVDC